MAIQRNVRRACHDNQARKMTGRSVKGRNLVGCAPAPFSNKMMSALTQCSGQVRRDIQWSRSVHHNCNSLFVNESNSRTTKPSTPVGVACRVACNRSRGASASKVPGGRSTGGTGRNRSTKSNALPQSPPSEELHQCDCQALVAASSISGKLARKSPSSLRVKTSPKVQA